MSIVIELLKGGVATIQDYLIAHLPFVIPAFFLAGALYALFPKEKILRYLGPNSPKHFAYPMSVVGGLCLAVCSCTILPLFAGIRRSGAGLGPAVVFLYTAPATNILAIIYTSSLIGWDVALARIILSIIFAIFIGITMSALFRRQGSRNRLRRGFYRSLCHYRQCEDIRMALGLLRYPPCHPAVGSLTRAEDTSEITRSGGSHRGTIFHC